MDRICIMMGGRVAEKLIFSKATTGASNDIKQATNLVRKLICDYGMTEELGPLSYGEKDESIFLGRNSTGIATIPKKPRKHRLHDAKIR